MIDCWRSGFGGGSGEGGKKKYRKPIKTAKNGLKWSCGSPAGAAHSPWLHIATHVPRAFRLYVFAGARRRRARSARSRQPAAPAAAHTRARAAEALGARASRIQVKGRAGRARVGARARCRPSSRALCTVDCTGGTVYCVRAPSHPHAGAAARRQPQPRGAWFSWTQWSGGAHALPRTR